MYFKPWIIIKWYLRRFVENVCDFSLNEVRRRHGFATVGNWLHGLGRVRPTPSALSTHTSNKLTPLGFGFDTVRTNYCHLDGRPPPGHTPSALRSWKPVIGLEVGRGIRLVALQMKGSYLPFRTLHVIIFRK